MKDYIFKQLSGEPNRSSYLESLDDSHRLSQLREVALNRSTLKIKDRYIQLLYIKIFKNIRKKYRRGNQFVIAEKIKTIFKNAKKSGAFEYISESELTLNSENEFWQYVPIPREIILAKKLEQNELRSYVLKEIGISKESMEYRFGGFSSLCSLNEYYSNATAAAIVQMKKRLIRKVTKRS